MLKNGISGLMQKKLTPLSNLLHPNCCSYQTSTETDNLVFFLDRICPKRLFSIKKKIWTSPLNSIIVCVSDFCLERQLWIFGPNLPLKDISSLKNIHHHKIQRVSIRLSTQISTYKRDFDSSDHICLKRVFHV